MKKLELLLLILVALLVVSHFDYQDEIIEHQHYCEMTALWSADMSLLLEQRRGWPPYDGECDGGN
jgi:hypothetical protein